MITPPKHHHPGLPRINRPASAFTLIEIMVVVVIIVLMVGMAIPVMHVITGSKSEEGARNTIAALLARARADAIGAQQPRGVAFIYNPGTGKSSAALVEMLACDDYVSGVAYPPGSAVKVNGATAYFWEADPFADTLKPLNGTPSASQSDSLDWHAVGGPPVDMLADTDLIPLPAGVGVRTVFNAQFDATGRSSNQYLPVGVILFDGRGRIASLPYGISHKGRLAKAAGIETAAPAYPGTNVYTYLLGSLGMYSQFGVVLYTRDAYDNQSFPTDVGVYSGSNSQYRNGSPSQSDADKWLDVNASPLVINRYTGELLRTE